MLRLWLRQWNLCFTVTRDNSLTKLNFCFDFDFVLTKNEVWLRMSPVTDPASTTTTTSTTGVPIDERSNGSRKPPLLFELLDGIVVNKILRHLRWRRIFGRDLEFWSHNGAAADCRLELSLATARQKAPILGGDKIARLTINMI